MKFQNSTASWQPLHCIVPVYFLTFFLSFFFFRAITVLICSAQFRRGTVDVYNAVEFTVDTAMLA